MFHGLDNRHLYTAYRLTCTLADNAGQTLNSAGTGFFVRTNDDHVVLVTNRHVVDPGFAEPKYAAFKLRTIHISGKANDPSSSLPSVDQGFVLTGWTVEYSNIPENDIVCLVNISGANSDGSPDMTIDYWVPQDLLATRSDFESKFSVCDFVAFPGFPKWYDKRRNRPILRTGTISSDPRYDYSWSSEYVGECVAYEAFSYGGSSGSPVFAVQKGPRPGEGISFPGFRELKLIGVNAGHIPGDNDTHSGISYMYRSSAVLDIIEPSKRAQTG
ncbi:MAG: trypsin-like peptidase domain-containing protein [Chloroflexota bacterium]|nr:trypsin-like peptidase domain-containing protein [Chloroflexota bacterium]